MKKVFLFLACASLMAMGAVAQKNVVKEVAKLAGSNKIEDLTKALNIVQPALTNPETMNNAETWLLAGKAAFGIYDQLSVLKNAGQEVDNDMLNSSLMNGFTFLEKALPLDSVKETEKNGALKLDKNGMPKIKTKFSPEIVELLTGHIDEVLNLGNVALGESRWDDAANAYTFFTNLLDAPFTKAKGIALADDAMSEVRFYQGYAQYQTQKFDEAYTNFTKAMALGYTENQVGDFKTSSMANIVQKFIDAKDYNSAYGFIDNALVAEPNSATLYDMKGFVAELEKGIEEALPFYKKATTLDANYADAFFNTGRALYLQASKIIEDNPDKTTAQFIPMLQPIYEEALQYFTKAQALDPENTKIPGLIDDINYKFEQMGIKK